MRPEPISSVVRMDAVLNREEGTKVHPAAAIVRKPLSAVLFLAAGVAAFVLLLVYGAGPHAAKASSHSEAPLISQDPRADNTDLYAFVSPGDTSKVTIVANYIPLEAPASGPNFYSFDDSVVYEIKIDNNGDGADDIGYQFRFHTATRNPNTFLYGTGPISSLSDPNWNRPQTYDVTFVHFNEHGTVEWGRNKPVVLGKNISTPPDNVGPRTTPNYDSLAAGAVADLGGGVKVFAGQRDDPFYVDLGSIFDLGGLRPFNPFHLIPLPAGPGVDALQNYNTHSIEIQVPISQLTDVEHPTIGIYATASRQKATVLRRDGTKIGFGPWVQVSRLGNPLINEVVIPLGQKDFWNRSEPEDDAQFEDRYTSPELAGVINLLYGVPPAPGHPGGALQHVDTSGRDDLKAVLLTGVPGLNFTGSTDADLLRLNTAIKPGANGACPGGTASAAAQSRLGVLAGDFCGFPNGRRLADDIVDIELRAVAQGYGPILAAALGLPNKSPNNVVGDGVDTNDVPFTGAFPYVASPHQGYEVP
jgi:hypothetical protein